MLRDLGRRKAPESAKVVTPIGDPVLTWKSDEVKFGPGFGEGRVFVSATSYDISLTNLPAGTKVHVDGKALPVSSSGMVSVSTDMSSRIASLTPKDAFDSHYLLDPKLHVEIEFSPTAKAVFDAPPHSISYALSELYKKTPDRPLPFARSTPPDEHSIVILGLIPEVTGPAKTLQDIDWAAISENRPGRPGKLCDGYKKTGSESGTPRSYNLEMVDQHVSVYDVATSKLIAEKDFSAPNVCPTMVFGGAAKSYANSADQKTWLRALRTATKK